MFTSCRPIISAFQEKLCGFCAKCLPSVDNTIVAQCLMFQLAVQRETLTWYFLIVFCPLDAVISYFVSISLKKFSFFVTVVKLKPESRREGKLSGPFCIHLHLFQGMDWISHFRRIFIEATRRKLCFSTFGFA